MYFFYMKSSVTMAESKKILHFKSAMEVAKNSAMADIWLHGMKSR